MSPAKSPSSSCRKGKVVAFDPPVVSEEVDRSDSERSTEEEAERDPDGECAPLIDPSYEISPHFLKVPSEYVPPPPGRVLISLGLRWPLQSPICPFAKVFHFLYPFTLNLGPAHPWVGRSGLIASFLTQALWVYCNGPAF